MKPIPGYEGRYSIDEDGRVFSAVRGIFLVHGKNTVGYPQVILARDGKKSAFAIHRLLALVFMDRKLGQQIDHIDGDRTNNDLSNLRLVSPAQNTQNKRRYKNNKSGFKGVRFYEKTHKWHATIQRDKKQIHLGYFVTKEEAARAYDEAAKIHFGEFASLNFPHVVVTKSA